VTSGRTRRKGVPPAAGEHLVGVVTESDLQTKVGCDYSDLSALTVSQVMTADPSARAARSPIAEAIRQMGDRGFSHLPLLSESGRLVQQLSEFSDLVRVAVGVFGRLRKASMLVPRHMSLLGYDNTFVAALEYLSIACVDQPRRKMGSLAVATSVERLANP
jgi:CBS domain-containing protein